jgi:hypothetical protein
MVFILIPAAWLVILGMVVSLCLTAARADAAVTAEQHRTPGERPIQWYGPAVSRTALQRPLAPTPRRRQAAPSLRRLPTARRRRVAAHGIR